MGDGHFRQRPAEQQRDERHEHVGQDDRGPGDVHRQPAGEEQPGTNRASQPHHRLLQRGQLPCEHLLVADSVDGVAHVGRSALSTAALAAVKPVALRMVSTSASRKRVISSAVL